ncbi:MAG: Hsp70 family protein [Candidatus Poribacteria bacterium]|nr:Hsp70 family protein [Candidatus Poribacteria bacterium]
MANHNDICIGIDLGTTNSVMAWGRIDSDGPIQANVIDIPMLAADGTVKKAPLLPSCIYFDDVENRPIVGEYGKYLIGKEAERVVKSIKLKMGEHKREKIGSVYYTAPEISTRILSQLKESAKQTFFRNIPFPDNVVIAVPASFEPKMRKATKTAGEYGGLFKNVTLVDEPVAVLHDFNNRLHKSDIPDRFDFSSSKTILVFDLGGGTLDVTLSTVEYGQNSYDLEVFDIVKPKRCVMIAGNNFDQKLSKFLLKKYMEKRPTALDISKQEMRYLESKFLLHAEEAKIDLSNQSELSKLFSSEELDPESICAEIEIEAYEDELFIHELKLSEYKKCVESLLAPGRELKDVDQFNPELDPKDIIDPILEVLKQAQVNLNLDAPPKPDAVLLNGSMAKLPMIQERLETFFGFAPDPVGDSDLAIARGAIIWWATEMRKQRKPTHRRRANG